MTAKRDERILKLFLKAIELDEGVRTRYLHDACGGDDELRKELESLLRHHSSKPLISNGSISGSDRRSSQRARFRITAHRLVTRLGRRWRSVALALALTLCLAALWLVLHAALHQELRKATQIQLETVLRADIGALEAWLDGEFQAAALWARHPMVRELLAQQARRPQKGLTTSELTATPEHARFLRVIAPLLEGSDRPFVGVFARDGHVIAKSPKPFVRDVYWSDRGAAYISAVFGGEVVFIPTFEPGQNVVVSVADEERAPEYEQRRSISIVAPVRDAEGDVVAALQVVKEIDRRFGKLLAMAQIGETGETYAFDRRGVVLSALRHTQQLREFGLLPEGKHPALNVAIQDPGVGPSSVTPADRERTNAPMTKVPALALVNGAALDVEGYDNYLGRRVVGAARWLPDYNFGVVAELGYDEAYAPLRKITWIFRGLFAAVSLAIPASLALLWPVRQVRAGRKLGQYTLIELLGEGGMGKVYLAHHAWLRRPTAIKLIEPHFSGGEVIELFEHEAQLASELTHPHTIQIYDYGRTEDGVLYYVMEYLSGWTLAALLARYGALPAARVIHILRQVCASLEEAHAKGFVHRDIKPSNIMLCELGGKLDFVKVLDFGLVMCAEAKGGRATRQRRGLSGTPLYIAPERIRDPSTLDPRLDLYSIGVVAYVLLTGKHPFDGESTMDVLYSAMNEEPQAPSLLVQQAIPQALEELVLACMEKRPEDRPEDVGVVARVLDELAVELPWTQHDARKAWGNEGLG